MPRLFSHRTFAWKQFTLASALLVTASSVPDLPGTLSTEGGKVQAQDAGSNDAEASAMFRNLDVNQDGKLTMAEAGPNGRQLMGNVFDLAGKNRSESVSRADFQIAFDRHKAMNGGRAGGPPNGGPPNGGPPNGGPGANRGNPGNGNNRPGNRPPGSPPGMPPGQAGARGPGPGGPSGEPPQGRLPQGRPPQNPDEGGLPPLFALLDGNHDGRITRAELQRLGQMFEQLDQNRDGALDRDELRPPRDVPPDPEDRRPANGGEADREPSESVDDTEAPKSSAPGTRSGSGRTAGSREASGSTPSSTSRTANRNTRDRTADGAAANQNTIAGVWQGWVVHGQGQNPNAGEMEIQLTIEGNQITGKELGTRRAPQGVGSGTFTITGDGRTGQLDSEGNSGPADGRSYLGIYELEGDTLRWCVSNRARQRPQTMATDGRNYLMVLRRQRN